MSDSTISMRSLGPTLGTTTGVTPPTPPPTTTHVETPSLRPEVQPPQDKALVVRFSASETEVSAVSMSVPEPVTNPTEVHTFLRENAMRMPQSVTRVGELYIIRLDDKTALKTSAKLLEQAFSSKVIPHNSGLSKALMMTELMTCEALPQRAQKAIRQLVSADRASMLTAQQSAIFAAFVEGFAGPENLSRVEAFISSAPETVRPQLQQAFAAFDQALTAALKSGQYEGAFDALQQFMATAQGVPGSESLYPPLPSSHLAPSNLIAIVNGLQSVEKPTLTVPSSGLSGSVGHVDSGSHSGGVSSSTQSHTQVSSSSAIEGTVVRPGEPPQVSPQDPLESPPPKKVMDSPMPSPKTSADTIPDGPTPKRSVDTHSMDVPEEDELPEELETLLPLSDAEVSSHQRRLEGSSQSGKLSMLGFLPSPHQAQVLSALGRQGPQLLTAMSEETRESVIPLLEPEPVAEFLYLILAHQQHSPDLRRQFPQVPEALRHSGAYETLSGERVVSAFTHSPEWQGVFDLRLLSPTQRQGVEAAIDQRSSALGEAIRERFSALGHGVNDDFADEDMDSVRFTLNPPPQPEYEPSDDGF